jgi:hypothetical protein
MCKCPVKKCKCPVKIANKLHKIYATLKFQIRAIP